MGSQRNQTADDKVQEGLVDSSKESGAATKGFYQKVWSRKIRLVYFSGVSLILIIVIIVVAVTLSDRYSDLRKHLCVDIEQESSGCSVCPDGWLLDRESCYYISPVTELTWNDSRLLCERTGADLLIIEDREEKEFIDGSRKGQKDKLFWIGMRRDGDGWKWVDGQRFDTGLFRISEESSGDCAGLYSGVEFYKDSCTNNNRWICEKRALKI